MEQPTERPENTGAYGSWLGLGWVILFCVVFCGFELPNNPGFVRYELWLPLLDALFECVFPLPDPEAPPGGWGYLGQRFPILMLSGFMLLSSWGYGRRLFQLIISSDHDSLQWSRLECGLMSMGVGLSFLSLLTLALGLAGLLSTYLFWFVDVVGIVLLLFPVQGRVDLASLRKSTHQWASSPMEWGMLGAMVCFAIPIVLGGMLPSVDFDVKEYHLNGPKEFFQSGSIHMLKHNVYTSMPFFTEMFSLHGMVLYNDWYWGALVGKSVLSSFAFLSALSVYAITRRLASHASALFAALVFLSTPWVYRMSIIAYTEGGLSLFVALSTLAFLLMVSLKDPALRFRVAVVVGLLSGSAIACKYPGLISVTIPIGLALLFQSWKTKTESALAPQVIKPLLAFSVGVLITFGPWALKNVLETGNPVYPLLNSVMGGSDWDQTLNEKWRDAHSPDHHQLSDIVTKLIDVTLKSDWQSPLVFGFAALTLPVLRRRREVGWLLLYVLWLFATWWVLTHRIDRFWVPMLPVVCVLAGIGFSLLKRPAKTFAFVPTFAFVVFNLGFVTTTLCGYNAYLVDLNYARLQTAKVTSPEVVALNALMDQKEGSVLFLGEAETFDAEFPHFYHTVFDLCLLEQWCMSAVHDPEATWKTRDEIEPEFRERNIVYVCVNWQEILRYRMTYRYTDFASPASINQLQQMGLLETALDGYPFFREWSTLNDQERQEIERWAPELIYTEPTSGDKYFVTTQVFPVRLL